MPPGFAGVEQQLLIWLMAAIRPGAAFLIAPVFGAPGVPVQLRIILALAIGVPASSLNAVALPAEGVIGVAGVAMIAGEATLGLALGLCVQLGLAAAVIAGEAISNAMGLGFASVVDPMGGQSSPAVGQFLAILATFLFLAMGGHLILASILIDSYQSLPPGRSWLSFESIRGLAMAGSLMFAAGLSIALPAGFAMLLVQIIMAMVARATPSLNLFAVGLPASIMAGLVLLAIATPVMSDGIVIGLHEALHSARLLANG